MNLIEFKNWADEIYIEYCENLSDEAYSYEIEGYSNSINKILGHMYEVYWSWYHFMTDQNYENEPKPEDMSREQIIAGIRKYNQKIMELVTSFDLKKTYEIQWDINDKVVITNAENVIFNFVTHSAYHRGQLAMYLRISGIEEIKETDFNPYIYEMGQQ